MGAIMNITDIKIRRLFSEGELRAVLSITFDNQLVVHDIKIISHDDRMIVAMPNRRLQTGYLDIVHPINAEFRNVIDNAVKKAYEEALDAERAENKEE